LLQLAAFISVPFWSKACVHCYCTVFTLVPNYTAAAAAAAAQLRLTLLLVLP